ncbi:MAG: class I SAM-dependent methyltransferase [Nitrososphaerota archaeon]|jgi:SAM-dependent methyltransferase|nr:class I SAM-dependent methyltransferase [Nitrososphaerota archaeon]
MSQKESNSAFRRFPIRKSELDRFKFGKQIFHQTIGFHPDDSVLCLDIACGANPFPKANVLCDLNVKPVPDRNMKKLVTSGKPFVMCSCTALPFRDKAFDFVTSYYLIEHLADPWLLVKELKRVSQHGYIQSPSWLNELFYGETVHFWVVFKNRDKLYVKPLKEGALPPFRFGFLFHRLYKYAPWRILHAILDEKFHLFTVIYTF